VSNVEKPCAAVEVKIKPKKLKIRRSQVIESTSVSDDSITCLGLETNSNLQVEEWEASPVNNSLSNNFSINLSPIHYRSLKDFSYHSSSNDPWIKEAFIYNGMGLLIFKMKRSTSSFYDVKQFEYGSQFINFNQILK
jgi:hypothetical protein